MNTERSSALMEIRGLKEYFPVTRGIFHKTVGHVHAVDDVSLTVEKGETVGIVGESGCGKTTLGKCVVRLNRPTAGSILLNMDGELRDIQTLSRKESFDARRRIQMIFQDPYSSLNPTKNILVAFDEPMKIHGQGNKAERLEKAAEMMRKVNLQQEYLYRYPHEFSGGQSQRICIAKSLALNPEMIVCDEPVSALDVSIQAQIMNLMKELQEEFGLTYLFIAHDLSVVQYMSTRVAVMYLGKIVETAPAKNFDKVCQHPYSQALLSAVPIPRVGAKKEEIVLSGDVPSPIHPPRGCRFHPRCSRCQNRCREEEPQLKALDGTGKHMAACHFL